MALLKVIVLSLALWSLINASGSQVLNEDSCTTDSQCHENAECVHYGIVRGKHCQCKSSYDYSRSPDGLPQCNKIPDWCETTADCGQRVCCGYALADQRMKKTCMTSDECSRRPETYHRVMD